MPRSRSSNAAARSSNTTPASRRYLFVVAMFECPALVIRATGLGPAMAISKRLAGHGIARIFSGHVSPAHLYAAMRAAWTVSQR